MKLFGSYTSPFVRHCRIALIESGIDFEFIETDQASSAEKTPTKRVPFLQDGNKFFTDSSSIIKHIRENYAGKLVTQSFLASAEELDKYCLINTLLDTSVNLFFLQRDGVKMDEVPYLQRQYARLESIIDEMNAWALPLQAPYNDVELRLACFMGWAKFRKRWDFTEYKNLENFYAGVTHYSIFAQTSPPEQ